MKKNEYFMKDTNIVNSESKCKIYSIYIPGFGYIDRRHLGQIDRQKVRQIDRKLDRQIDIKVT